MKGKLILTVEQAQKDHDAWLRVRSEGLGGSDIGAIMGVNSHKSPYQLWLDKVEPSKAEDISNKPVVRLGSFLEQYAVDLFCEDTGKKIRRCGTLADEEFPFLHANVDRLIVGEEAGLEIKTASNFLKDEWEDDKVPDSYYLQCQFYMRVTGLPRWYIACLFRDSGDFIWKVIERHEDDIKALTEGAVAFWNDNVLAGNPPKVDGSQSTAEALGRVYDNPMDAAIPLSSECQEYIRHWDEIKTTKKLLDKQEELIANYFKAILGNNEHGIIGDRRVDWTSRAGAVTVDKQMLAEKYPAIYAECLHVGKPSRSFAIKTIKEKKKKK